MNLDNIDLKNAIEKLVPLNYLSTALNANKTYENACRILFQTKKIPDNGWDDLWIERLIQQLSSLDSNNFVNKCGVGEREARIACKLVHRRHYGFAHGIGRSGDLGEAQPKAIGSTILNQITNALVLHLLQVMGIQNAKKSVVIPMATGMTLSLCLQSLKQQLPNKTAKYVLWSRIDQKSAFKCILSANLIPVIIEPIICEHNSESKNSEHDQSQKCYLKTNIVEFQRKIIELGSENIVCILSTTSCFAPRQPDDIIALSKLAQKENVAHLINNAYGLQCRKILNKIEYAVRSGGRIDLFVQSTDKNLMVPIGGSIIATNFDAQLIENVTKEYCGRASISPILDVFMTLLSLGVNGYKKLIKEREHHFVYLQTSICKMPEWKNSENCLYYNSISIAIPLENDFHMKSDNISEIGSMLFKRNVSGARVITGIINKAIGDYSFQNWGGHISNTAIFPIGPYLTVACGIGTEAEDIDIFIKKFKEIFVWASKKERNN